MFTRISTIQKNLELLRTHTSHLVVPEGLNISVQCDGPYPCISIHCPRSYSDEEDSTLLRNREAVLDLAGKWFGKSDWLQSEDYSNKYYNWSKKWNGISLTIHSAKVIPRQRDGTPVSPSEFPLLLENVSPEEDVEAS